MTIKQIAASKVVLSPKLTKLVNAFQDTYGGRPAKNLLDNKSLFPIESKIISATRLYYRGMSLPIKLVQSLIATGKLKLAPSYVSSWEDPSKNTHPALKDAANSPYASASKNNHVGISIKKHLNPKSVIFNAATLDSTGYGGMFQDNEVVIDGASKDATLITIQDIHALSMEPSELSLFGIESKLAGKVKANVVKVYLKNGKFSYLGFLGRTSYKEEKL